MDIVWRFPTWRLGMCVICHDGPMILGGVPAAGLIVARVRQAFGRETAPQEASTPPTL